MFLDPIFALFFKIPWVKDYWTKRYAALESDSIPWSKLNKPLNQCKVGFVTTAGIHKKTDTPFDMKNRNGDPSFRLFPSNPDKDDLKITHNYYDHRNADKDLNIVLPFDGLQTLVNEGVIGSVTTQFMSFMGHVMEDEVEKLTQETAPKAAKLMLAEEVDVVIFSPA